MLDLTSNPLPEREQNLLLMAVRDIMNNGGRIPQDVSNELIMAAIMELNGCVKANANLSRKNALGLKLLGVSFVVLATVIIGLHGDDWGLVGTLMSVIGP